MTKIQEEKTITVHTLIDAPVDIVWKCWTTPEDVKQWNNASPDWHTPHAENNLKVGNRFSYRMEARDGSAGFDFSGVYKKIIPNKEIKFTIDDGRNVEIEFSAEGFKTEVVETFEAENQNSKKMQQQGWQAILDNFKRYVEENSV